LVEEDWKKTPPLCMWLPSGGGSACVVHVIFLDKCHGMYIKLMVLAIYRIVKYHIDELGSKPFATRSSATTFTLLKHHFLNNVAVDIPETFTIYVVEPDATDNNVKLQFPESEYGGTLPVGDLEVVLRPPRPRGQPIVVRGPFGDETFYRHNF
jgi:hypothetical protein